jgi:peptide/nickel transport system substrate-binding protein
VVPKSKHSYDPEKAKKLLAEAGVTLPLEISLKLPPPAYARQGGEILAAQLAKVGITAKIENVEWAQWLSQVFAPNGPHNFDMTIVSHVEPFDLVKLTEADYYLGYNNEKFNALYKQITATPKEADRARLLGDAQKMLASDAVAVFMFQPQWITVSAKKLAKRPRSGFPIEGVKLYINIIYDALSAPAGAQIMLTC